MRSKLKAIRKEAGYTQQQLANIVCVSRPHYTRIEKGDRDPSWKVSLKIKRALNYQADDIFYN